MKVVSKHPVENQNLKIGQRPEQELLAKATQIGRLRLCTRCLWHFLRARDILQRFQPGWWSGYTRICACVRKTPYLGIFCTLFIIITVRRIFVQIRLAQQPSFRYRFQAICCRSEKFRRCRFFVLLHYSSYKLCDIFEKKTDKNQIM